MTILQNLAALALRPFLGDGADVVVDALDKFFNDPSQRWIQALHRASSRSWKSLEMALAGESLWERCKALLTPGEEAALRPLVRSFLEAAPLVGLDGNRTEVRKHCLRELRAAREDGLLTGGAPAAEVIKRKASAFAADPSLNQEWAAVEEIIQELGKKGHKNLAWLLGQRPRGGRPLLVVAVRYFFRCEIEADAEFTHGLAYEQLDDLAQRQRAAFRNLDQVLQQLGGRFDGLVSIAGEIRDTILDLHAELKRQGTEIERVQDLGRQVLALLQRHADLQRRPLDPKDSYSCSDENERQLVRRLKACFRALPEEQRRLPALLHALGKLQVVIGDFSDAQQDFQTVADMVPEGRKAQAEPHYHAFRAALEGADWPAAFASIRQAAALDPERFAPFPADRFEPVKILGAGGFGVAFLCRHRRTNKPLVVKTLLAEDLDRDVKEVFAEAGILEELAHPAIIRLRDCDYADAARRRPYLVMDYFDGESLHDYVEKHGVLRPAELLPIARAAEALCDVHAKKIYHRDIKPANLLVRGGEAGWEVRIIDFGLALRRPDGQAADAVGQGKSLLGKCVVGTEGYAAPEQRQPQPDAPVGPHSDVYGIGRSRYYALLMSKTPPSGVRN